MGMRPKYHNPHDSCPLSNGAMIRAMMLMSLIRMLREGPDVSLKGSPTVSPTTQAL
jgi:hypothetical protein